jgi:hypothetical protein
VIRDVPLAQGLAADAGWAAFGAGRAAGAGADAAGAAPAPRPGRIVCCCELSSQGRSWNALPHRYIAAVAGAAANTAMTANRAGRDFFIRSFGAGPS